MDIYGESMTEEKRRSRNPVPQEMRDVPEQFFKKRRRRLHNLWIEIFLTLAGIGVCLAVFLFGLSQVFPHFSLVNSWFNDAGPSVAGGGENQNAGSVPVLSEGQSAVIAHLTAIQNDVKSKRDGEVVWSRAQEGLKLYGRDAIRTLSRSNAVVTFDDHNSLDIGENSLVLLKYHGYDSKQGIQKSLMELVDGQVRSQIDGDHEAKVGMEIITPSALTEIHSDGGDHQKADVQVHVKPDQSAAVMVYAGRAKVTAQGVTIDVARNRVAHIPVGRPPQPPQGLPGLLTALSPEEGGIYFYREGPPEVAFSWSPSDAKMSYHLQVSSASGFKNRLLDEKVPVAAFSSRALKEGRYFWRVAAVDAEGIEGGWSVVRSLEVVRSGVFAVLRLYAPKDGQVVFQETVLVEGETDPRSEVYLNGKAIPVSDVGYFRKEILLKIGDNEVQVESVNQAGAASFQRRMVRRQRFKP